MQTIFAKWICKQLLLGFTLLHEPDISSEARISSDNYVGRCPTKLYS